MIMNRKSRGEWLVAVAVVLPSVVLIGCGPQDPVVSSPQNAVQEKVTDSVDALIKKLEIISTTGEGGSSLEGIRDSIEKNVADPEAKKSLLGDATRLNSATTPESIKKIAAKMLATLKK